MKRETDKILSEAAAKIKDRVESVRAIAVKKGQSQKELTTLQEMGTLRCDVCGEEFVIRHHTTFADKNSAERQAHWLEKVLAEEHEREKKHADRIELPD